MTRKEEILRFICLEYGKCIEEGQVYPVDTNYIAERLGLLRSAVSREVNSLCKEGALVKKGKKPIVYYPAEQKSKEDNCKNRVSGHQVYGFDTIYEFTEDRLIQYRNTGLTREEIDVSIHMDIERYYIMEYRNACERCFREKLPVCSQEVQEDRDILILAAKIIARYAGCADNHEKMIRSHLLSEHIKQCKMRIDGHKRIVYPDLQNKLGTMKKEAGIIRKLLDSIEAVLKCRLPEDETGYLLLYIFGPKHNGREPEPGVVLCTYGAGVASAVADNINKLLMTEKVGAVEIVNDELTDIYEKLCREVKRDRGGKGVFVVTDVSEVFYIENELRDSTGINCRVLPFGDVRYFIKAVRLTMIKPDYIDYLYSEVTSLFLQTYGNYRKLMKMDAGTVPEPEFGEPSGITILSICPTGAGTAIKVRDYLTRNIHFTSEVTIIPVSALEDIMVLVRELRSSLKLIVGSINPGIPGVPFIGMEDIFHQNGLAKIKNIINMIEIGDQKGNDYTSMDIGSATEVIEEQIERFAPSLNGEEVIRTCRGILFDLESSYYKQKLPHDMIFRIFMHSVCMMERLKEGLAMEYPDWGSDIEGQEGYAQVREMLMNWTDQMDLKMTEAEVCYFMQAIPELSLLA